MLVQQVGVPREQLGGVVARKPQLLGYSLPAKLKPALAFFRHEIGRHSCAY